MVDNITSDTTVTDVTPIEQSSQVADTDNTQTQDTQVLEENNSSDLTTTTEPFDNNTAEVEDITEQVDPSTEATSKAPEVEQLQSRLREYELRDEEATRIRERLNLPQADPRIVQYETIEAQINNHSQREWIELCNKYGVDYTPQGIEKSCAELESKDPKAYYQFKSDMDRFSNNLEARKYEISSQRKNYEVNNFYQANKDLIDGSPVVRQMVSSYIQQNFNNMHNPTAELGGLMDAIRAILLEGVEVGKAYSQVEKAKNDKSRVNANSSIATANTQTTSLDSGRKWTASKVASLSTSEFEKYEKEIVNAMNNGLIE